MSPAPNPSSSARQPTPAARIARLVDEYHQHDNVGLLFDGIRTLARETEPADLIEATKAFRDLPEVVIPAFEFITERRPDDAQSLVVLANAYWLTGRGPEAVGRLARRAMELDADNRGAWHLYALSESDPRARMERWREVTIRFPADHLARAALADNATSVAGAEHDPAALELALETYESLLRESTNAAQRKALRETIDTLKKWTV
jgi:hypothetical protein